ncbi:hypothetical protein [Mesorhizobium sp.]|uniref:hypothetical protein n=1 Tax=Mesorhizobium sp. TaxID=1871066 RepID=UPI000FE58514|nr:hypothetical protein [Mesorhizobium sp.]RWO88314.1 MAG: hypothetical protein EOQ96_08880 [Mesorhizobium sp.]
MNSQLQERPWLQVLSITTESRLVSRAYRKDDQAAEEAPSYVAVVAPIIVSQEVDAMGRATKVWHPSALLDLPSERGTRCRQSFEASRPLNQDNTIVDVIEMSKGKWLIGALVPGVKRQPLKKIDADAPSLLKLLQDLRDEAGQAGHTIKRIAVT